MRKDEKRRRCMIEGMCGPLGRVGFSRKSALGSRRSLDADFRLPAPAPEEYRATMNMMTEEQSLTPPDVVVHGNAREFLQNIVAGKHHLRADEPQSYGGSDAAPGPYDYLLIGLGVCTSMTVGLYARKRRLPLENITVSLRHSRIHAKDCDDCETKEGLLDRIDLALELTGPLTPEQHAKLMEITGKCPVHRTLKSEIEIKLHAGAPT